MSLWQIASFVLATLVGGVIVLLGIQAYRDADRFLATGDNVLSGEQLVITKPVSGMTTVTSMLGLEPGFTEREMNQLRALPSVARVGSFVPARCRVSGQIALGNLNMTTDMFLEAVPDAFIDVPIADGQLDWQAGLDDRVVPIIIPRSYLNLYNYGYASTRGLPQISEGIISSFPLRLMLQGNGQTRIYEARILGFSNKLNTILAPKNFIDAVNASMQTEAEKKPSRLIVTTAMGQHDSELLQYVEQQGYVIEGNADAVKMQVLVHSVLWVLIGIGLLVSLLAFYQLVVSILLLIEKNKARLQTLSFLGYPVSTVARPYQCMVGLTDFIAWMIAAGILVAVYPRITDLLQSLSPDYCPAPLGYVFLTALVFAAFFALLHSWLMYRQIKQV